MSNYNMSESIQPTAGRSHLLPITS